MDSLGQSLLRAPGDDEVGRIRLDIINAGLGCPQVDTTQRLDAIDPAGPASSASGALGRSVPRSSRAWPATFLAPEPRPRPGAALRRGGLSERRRDRCYKLVTN